MSTELKKRETPLLQCINPTCKWEGQEAIKIQKASLQYKGNYMVEACPECAWQIKEKPKPKIYIAGKVSGESKHSCALKFATAQKMLEEKGYEVLNPIELVGDFNMPWVPAMVICTRVITNELPEMYFLDDWTESTGAPRELFIAEMFNLKIHYEKKPRHAVELIIKEKS